MVAFLYFVFFSLSVLVNSARNLNIFPLSSWESLLLIHSFQLSKTLFIIVIRELALPFRGKIWTFKSLIWLTIFFWFHCTSLKLVIFHWFFLFLFFNWTLVAVQFYILQIYNIVIHNFKGYTAFIGVMKYWLYVLLYNLSLYFTYFIHYSMYLLIPNSKISPHFPSPNW